RDIDGHGHPSALLDHGNRPPPPAEPPSGGGGGDGGVHHHHHYHVETWLPAMGDLPVRPAPPVLTREETAMLLYRAFDRKALERLLELHRAGKLTGKRIGPGYMYPLKNVLDFINK